MDELRRNAKLISEILSRASVIENSMSDTTQRLEHIKQVEENHLNKLQQQQQQQEQENTLANSFTALTDDIILNILHKISDVQDLLSICQVNKRLEMLALRNEEFWQNKCIRDWNIQLENPNHAKNFKLIVLQKYDGIIDKVQKGQIMYKYNNSNDGSQISWYDLYQDRYRGKNLVSRILDWLGEKNHPSDVTGQIHKIQLLIALEYLNLFVGEEFNNFFEDMITNTGNYATQQQYQNLYNLNKQENQIKNDIYFNTPIPTLTSNKDIQYFQNCTSIYKEIFQQTTVQSMLALLENNNYFVLDLALQILLNIGIINQQLQQYLIEQSSNGRKIINLLNSKDDQVVKSATKLLIFMWLHEKIPNLNLNQQSCQNSKFLSTIIGSNLVLQELSSRGKILRSHLFILYHKESTTSKFFSSNSNCKYKTSNVQISKFNCSNKNCDGFQEIICDNVEVGGEGFITPDVQRLTTITGSINAQQMTIQLVILDIELDQQVNLRGWIGDNCIYGVYQYQRLEGAGQKFVVSQEVLPRIFYIFPND